MRCALLASLASTPVLLPLWLFCLFDWLLYLLSRHHCGHSTWLFFFLDTQISLMDRGWQLWGRGSSGGGGGAFTAQLVHWHCFLSPMASSHLDWRKFRCAGPQMIHLPWTLATQWLGPEAVLWLVKPDSPNVLLLSRRLPFLYSRCLLGLYFLFLFSSRLLPSGTLFTFITQLLLLQGLLYNYLLNLCFFPYILSLISTWTFTISKLCVSMIIYFLHSCKWHVQYIVLYLSNS